MSGLLNEIILATELPLDGLRSEMEKIFAASGIDTDTQDIEEIRKVLARYLQDTLVELKQELDVEK